MRELRLLLVSPSRSVHRRFGQMLSEDRSPAPAAVLNVAECAAEGLERLRSSPHAAILAHYLPNLHRGGNPEALEMLGAIQAEGSNCPFIVIGEESEASLSPSCCRAGADAYVGLANLTWPHLSSVLDRALERRRLLAENHRLRVDERHRLEKDRRDAKRMLSGQRELLSGLMESQRRDTESFSDDLPRSVALVSTLESAPPLAPVNQVYEQILNAWIVDGPRKLGESIAAIAQRMREESVSSQQVFLLHHETLRRILAGLGESSVPRVARQADLLLTEVMANLVEAYRGALVLGAASGHALGAASGHALGAASGHVSETRGPAPVQVRRARRRAPS